MIALVLALQVMSSPAPVYVQAQLPRYPMKAANPLSGRVARLDKIIKIGFKGVGVSFEWREIEGVPHRVVWSRPDSVIREATARGLELFGLLTYSPRWAVPPGLADIPRIDSHRPTLDGSSDLGDVAFAHFAALVVRRYSRWIKRWEVWNEENSPLFWIASRDGGVNSGPSARDYAKLYRVSRDSILTADPEARVAIGGLASFSGRVTTVIDPLDPARKVTALPAHLFLRAVLADGITPSAVAIHPYSTTAPGVKRLGEMVPVFPDQVVDSVIAVLNEAGLTSVPLWVTEWGVDAHQVPDSRVLTNWVTSGLHSLRCNPRIEFVTIYSLTDPNPNTEFGVADESGRLTALGRALKDAIQSPEPCDKS